MDIADKKKLSEILAHAASRDRTVIEFQTTADESLTVADITEHVEVLEDAYDD